jgi:hypothetical protein
MSPRTLGIGALALVAAFAIAFAAGKATAGGSDETDGKAEAVAVEPSADKVHAPALGTVAKVPALRVPKQPAGDGGSPASSEGTTSSAPSTQSVPTPTQSAPPAVNNTTPPSSPPQDSPPVADPNPG